MEIWWKISRVKVGLRIIKKENRINRNLIKKIKNNLRISIIIILMKSQIIILAHSIKFLNIVLFHLKILLLLMIILIIVLMVMSKAMGRWNICRGCNLLGNIMGNIMGNNIMDNIMDNIRICIQELVKDMYRDMYKIIWDICSMGIINKDI